MMDPKATEIPNQNSGKTQVVSFKSDGTTLVGGETTGNLRQWNVDSSEEISPSAMTAKGNVYAVVASMDGKWIVSGDLGNKVIVWNAATHKIAIQISEHSSYVYSVDVSSDSVRVASGSEDHTVRIFNIVSGVRLVAPLQHDGGVVGVKFSPDGSRIATAVYQHTSVGVYDANAGNKLFNISVRVNWAPITPLAWSSDGQQLFVGSPGKITYFETSSQSREEWLIQNGNNNVSVVTHGRYIACSAGSSVSFWDYTSRQQIGSIVDHPTTVNCISISHDGRYLACGRDGAITVHSLSDILPREYLSGPLMSRIPLMQISEAALESWMQGDPMETEALLSEEIAQNSDPTYHVFAARSLIRGRLRDWKAAIEDAERSLQIEQSTVGQIARSVALIGAGKHEIALDDFDFVFRDSSPSDNMLLLVFKSILVFICGKRKQAVSRLRGLITAAAEKSKGHYIQVLGNMYLKLGDYENAVQTLERAKDLSTSETRESNPLVTISLIFNWNFDNLELTAWQRLCESLYRTGCIKEVGETLLKMVSPLPEDEKEPTHGRILEEIVTRSGQVTLLAWTGKSSTCNSCLPSSPSVYDQLSTALTLLEPDELDKRTEELQNVFPLADALVMYGRVTRLQPVRFVHFHLHLPCIVFRVKSLRKDDDNVYHAETTVLGEVEFTTADALPLEPWRLVFADARIHGFLEPRGATALQESRLESDAESASDMGNSPSVVDSDVELVQASIIEEAPSKAKPVDVYTRALQLIAHLGQRFSPLLLLRQSDGAYKRVAADHEMVVGGMGNNVPKDIRVEVLEIL